LQAYRRALEDEVKLENERLASLKAELVRVNTTKVLA
jgi:hypothetical protein